MCDSTKGEDTQPFYLIRRPFLLSRLSLLNRIIQPAHGIRTGRRKNVWARENVKLGFELVCGSECVSTLYRHGTLSISPYLYPLVTGGFQKREDF